MSADFPALEHVLAQSQAAKAVRLCSAAVSTAWTHSAASRQVARGRAALSALPAGGRVRFWSVTIIWMGLGMMVAGMLVPRYSAPSWPVGQGLGVAILGAVLAAGSMPLAAAWSRSRLRHWYRAERPDQTSDV